jgi:hypothetical protein
MQSLSVGLIQYQRKEQNIRNTKISVVWNVTPCSALNMEAAASSQDTDTYQPTSMVSHEIYCLHHQDRRFFCPGDGGSRLLLTYLLFYMKLHPPFIVTIARISNLTH